MTVVLAVLCFFLVRHFRIINKKRDDESIAKKKVADRRVAETAQASRAEGGTAGYQAEDASYATSGGVDVPLLR